ncbi:Spermidine synthase [Enhygromyxa salina]|uniref:Spermidine synthase n=1 Tax=Enhygromyxa salina TaxID=215803 RepID=A0A0C1Z9C9_9BACT|nr:fused MFS/spermidine synthase [Enhygromyxa salina]KIG14189.1 Spermidine synthase [Enhygromyxa salina]
MGRSRHLFLLFFLSGISGLVYESLWSRYLKLFVGSAATAQILVLALFMGGMSLGSLLAGRYSARIQRPVLIYGLIEGLIGLYALAFPYLYDGVTRLCYDVVFPAVGGGGGVSLAKWSAAAMLIAPSCVLLGMTFPLMSVGILRRDRERSGEILSFLYFSNSFGASLGALLSGFLLVPLLGLPGTLAAAAVLNLLIGAMCLRERGRDADPPLADHDEPAEPSESSKASANANDEVKSAGRGPSLLTLMLLIALGTGLSSFMYEIAWIRMLSMVLGSATHSFEVMLSVFVLGLALGGLWVRKRMDKFKRPELTLGLVQLIMGAAAVATIPLYRLGVLAIGGVYWVSVNYLDGERTVELWYLFNVVRYLVCLVIMLPATFCAGMTLPLVTHVLLRRGRPESAVGKVYGVNTLGAIIGAISAGILLLPLVGIKTVIVMGALVDMGLGVWLVAREQSLRPSPTVRKLVTSTTLATAAVAVIGFGVLNIDPRTLASGVFRRGTIKMHDDYVVALHKDGRTATVTVTEDSAREGYHTLFTNGKPDASIYTVRWPEGRDPSEGPMLAGDEPTQLLLAIIPLLTKPDARLAATIGMGSGITSHSLLASPTLERLDTVEIEPFMAEGAKLFHPVNRRTFEDPRSNLIFDDAKAYFAAAEARYDLVVSEPSNPWVAGVSSLFTIEFYDEIKRYLTDDGLFGQWVHGYELSDELLLSVLAAVDQSFADYRVYRVGGRDWLILASQQPGGVGELDEGALAWPDLRDDAALLGIQALSQIQSLQVANTELLRPYLHGLQPNTDARPLLDNGAERARFFKRSAEALLELRAYPLPLLEVLGGEARPPYADRIPDRRVDEHVLHESERALFLMRLWELDNREPYPGTSTLRSYYTQRDNLAAKPGEPAQAKAWFDGVYGVFHTTAPWIAVEDTPFWASVLDTARSEAVTPEVRRGIEILDLIERRDGAKLWVAVEAELAHGDSVLPPRILAMAGALALALEDASGEQRRAFADTHMRPLLVEPAAVSEDIAYAMVVAWMSSP